MNDNHQPIPDQIREAKAIPRDEFNQLILNEFLENATVRKEHKPLIQIIYNRIFRKG